MKNCPVKDRSGFGLLEILLAGTVVIAGFFVLSKVFSDDVSKMESLKRQWRATLIAESVVNSVAAMSSNELYELIVIEKKMNAWKQPFEETTQTWLSSWRKGDGFFINGLSFTVRVFCPVSLGPRVEVEVLPATKVEFSVCEKKISSKVLYELPEKKGSREIAWEETVLGR